MTSDVIAFEVPGNPQGKGRVRSRISKSKATGKQFVQTYTPAKTVTYEGTIAVACAAAMSGRAPLAGPIWMRLEIYDAVPSSWTRTRRNMALAGYILPSRKPDADNILKAIGDGGNGVGWVDDKQIGAKVTIVRAFSERPRLYVAFCAAKAPGGGIAEGA